MKKHWTKGVVAAAVGMVLSLSGYLFCEVASAKSTEVWLADLDVTLTAVEDRALGQITHHITVTNNGDDDGRDIVITHIPVIGVKVLSIKPQHSTCVLKTYNTTVQVIQCTLPQLGVLGTENLTVVTSNATTWTGRKITTAQVMGAAPDFDGCNNTASVEFP
jgi:hypothetical protein